MVQNTLQNEVHGSEQGVGDNKEWAAECRMGCKVQNGVQGSDRGTGYRTGVQDRVQEMMQIRVHSAEQVARCRTGSRG